MMCSDKEWRRTCLGARFWIALALLCALWLPGARAQENPPAPTEISVETLPPVVRGTILDNEHAPVAGATVEIEVLSGSTRRPIFKTRARTGDDGRYEADLSAVEERWLGVQVTAHSPRHAEGFRLEVIEKTSLPIEISLQLDPGIRLTGRTLNEAGEPVAGAKVEIPYQRQTVSEFDGFFALEGVRMAPRFKLTASAEGYAPQTITVRLNENGEAPPIEFRLKTQRIVRGKALDAGEKPVADAEITLLLPETSRVTRTNGEGEFQFTDLPYEASKAMIRAAHRDFAPYEEERVVEEGDTAMEIHLQRPATLTGKITGAAGDAIPGAQVALSLPEAMPRATVTSDSQGNYRIEGIPPLELVATVFTARAGAQARSGELLLRQEGQRLSGDVDPWPDETASDFTGEARKENIRLERRDRASGAAAAKAAPSSEPDAIYEGKLSSDGLRAMGRFREPKTRRAGAWEARREQATPGNLGGLWIWKETAEAAAEEARPLAPARKKITLAPGEAATENFTLEEGWTLRARVLNESGQPAANAKAWMSRWMDANLRMFETQTDAAGELTLSGLPRQAPFVINLAHPEEGYGRIEITEIPKNDKQIEVKIGWNQAPPRAELDGGPGAENYMTAGPKTGAKAPAFEGKAIDGQTISLDSLKGKVALLDFWASWCGPCVEELPNLRAVHAKYGHRKDFQILGVSLDDDEQSMRSALKEYGANWPQIFDAKGWETPIARQFNIKAIPRIYLIGRDGVILERDLRGDAIEAAVEKALGPEPAP